MTTQTRPGRPVWILLMGIVLAAVSASHLSFTTTSLPGKFWSQLGLSEARGTDYIRKSILEGYLYTYGASAAKKLAAGERVALTRDVMSYAKSYVASPEFEQAYLESREQQKPVPPAAAKTKAEIQAEQIASIEKTIVETEKSMNAMSADMREPMKDVIRMFNEQLEDFKNPESEMLKYMVESEKYTFAAASDTYRMNVANWEKNFPGNYKMMIRTRLETFLTATADVDFNATLREEYGLKKFTNAVYEKKSDEWKMAYRAGKPVVDAARDFATQWLKELQ